MSRQQFRELMSDTGWGSAALNRLFRSFSARKASSLPSMLSFAELLAGLAACEPATPHGDLPGEARCRIIFRYYNQDSNGKLSFKEFCDLVRDVREAKGFSTDTKDVEDEATLSAKYPDIHSCN